MASEFAARELARVQLAPRDGGDEDASHHSDSEYESDLSTDDGEGDYDVEAIKWAIWRDSRKDKHKGHVGWHYGIIWLDYFKNGSDSEEPKSSFTHNAGETDVVREFWNSLDRKQYPFIVPERIREMREPRKPAPMFRERHIEAPEKYMRRRFAKAKSDLAKRSYETFAQRQKWLVDNGLRPVIHEFPKVPRRYSDYYQLHIKEKRAERERLAKDGVSTTAEGPREERPGPAEAGPSTAPPISVTPAEPTARRPSDQTSPSSNAPRPSPQADQDDPMVATSPRRTIARPSASVAPSLDSLFDETTSQAPTPAASTATSTSATLQPAQPMAKKRKIVESPESQPGAKAPRTEAVPPSNPASSYTAKPATKGKGLITALASIGKIAKKKNDPTPPPGPSSQPSFGDPQPGIFDGPAQPAPATAPVAEVSPPISTASATSTAPAPTSKLFIDPEDATPGASTTTAKPVEVKPEPMSATAGPSTPPLAKVPLSERPKYQQPVRIKKIDDVPLSRSRKLPPKPQSGPGAAGGASPIDPSVRPAYKSPMTPYTGESPDYGGRTPTAPGSSASNQPRSSAFIPRNSASGTFQPAQSVQGLGTVAPLVRPPLPTPVAPVPYHARPPSGPRGFRPPRPVPTGPANGVPHQPPNLLSPSHPGPSAAGPSLDPPGQAPSAYNVAADPRRKAAAHASPVLPNLPSPVESAERGGKDPTNEARPRLPSRQSRADFSVPLEITANMPLRDELETSSLDMHLLPGAALTARETTLAQALLRHESGKAAITFEEVEPVAVRGNIRLGANVVEWVRAALITKENAGKAYTECWSLLKDKVKGNKVYVSYAELEATNPKHHYAILIASPSVVDISRLGLGRWEKDEISVGIFILQLPLTSAPPPQLSNPVRATLPVDVKPDLPDFPQPADILASYGMSSDFFNQYRGRRVVKYPIPDHKVDILDRQLTDALKKNEITGVAPKSSPDFVVLLNQRFGGSIRPSIIRNAVRRRTPIFACGPSLSLYPSQYGLQEIWQRGALVTFSPSFILHQPDRFAAAMRLIRLSNHWAAYITPAVIEWCQESWGIPARCSDAVVAYRELTKALVFDAAVLKISGSHADSGGDLAVSCAPPCIHDDDGCAAWQAWLSKVLGQTDFDGIVSACQGVSTQTFKTDSDDKKPTSSLDLVDVEQGQLEDLSAMRMRPHLLPYRRYLYVGEVSLPREERERLGATIEFVAADDFTATFSGVV